MLIKDSFFLDFILFYFFYYQILENMENYLYKRFSIKTNMSDNNYKLKRA